MTTPAFTDPNPLVDPLDPESPRLQDTAAWTGTDPHHWMTPKQVAAAFDNVGLSTVYYWIRVKRYFRVKMNGYRYLIWADDVRHFTDQDMAVDQAKKAARTA